MASRIVDTIDGTQHTRNKFLSVSRPRHLKDDANYRLDGYKRLMSNRAKVKNIVRTSVSSEYMRP